ncbi:NAD-dependent epimerase/dehydratase family protein [Nitrosomonas mobilis]|uniref:NAD-dependent epimerase/dehydratase n=1 Tax=Nitrosomonas mobilis TaxID=51642 RepID=A0A1G5SB42_9PROT|nr:NAD(P)-dependent oxidoreductase [Nitrosomonas mobilis]SCZ84338.1 NAD-dependent epimerase/dehydratase [Nitrosomonas mobilis]HNO75954.1 NAD(P)-dependent oxidoreductase [Nitrosomonas mobilis]
MTRLVAVTGATGFIGQQLLKQLVGKGWKVRALTRQSSVPFSHSAVEWIVGDLSCIEKLKNLVASADTVIHCAGAVKGNSWNSFLSSNVVGTKHILQAITKTNSCSRLLYISSLAARQPQLSWYAKSKYDAEQLLSMVDDRLAVTIFRPAAVYGPGDKALTPLLQAMRYGVLPVLSPATNRFGLVHVNDLVEAVLCWLDSGPPISGVYEIDDGTPGGYDYAMIASIAEQVLKRKVRYVRIPLKGLSSLAKLNLWLASVLGYAPMLTPGKVQELQYPDWTCDITALQKVLQNWYPEIQLDIALPVLIQS